MKGRFCTWLALGMASLIWSMAVAGTLPFSQGVLFQIEKDGAPVSYLFGTIHSEDKRVLALPGPVEQAFMASSQLYVEVDMEPASLLASVAGMMLDDGRKITDLLEPALYQQVVDAAAKLGLPEVALRYYKPWALAMLLSLPPAETGEFLDLVLYQRARTLNKKVSGLETIDEQLGLFDALSEDDQIALLQDALNNLDQLPTIFQALLDRYLDRDLAGLVAINQQLVDADRSRLAGRFQVKLIDERNKRMVDRLAGPLTEGGIFVAVGALHLPGEHGMLRLLEQRGYRVVRKY